jgi:hypothetical protein
MEGKALPGAGVIRRCQEQAGIKDSYGREWEQYGYKDEI